MYISVTLVDDTQTHLHLQTYDPTLRRVTLLTICGGESLKVYNRAALVQQGTNDIYAVLRTRYDKLETLCNVAAPGSTAGQDLKNMVHEPFTRTRITIGNGSDMLKPGISITLADPGLGSPLPLVHDIVRDLVITG